MNLRLISAFILILFFRPALEASAAGEISYIQDSVGLDPVLELLPDNIEEEAPVQLAETATRDNPDFCINRLRAKNFQIQDTTIIYPKFLGFCVNVYNWADRTFNTYDHDYVQPSGKKWKVMWKNSNWFDSYALDMPDNVHMRMLSSLYMSTGPYLSFMAVTVGYAANLNRLITKEPTRQKRYDFSFSTALFEVDLYYTRNRDGTRVRRFEPYDQGRYIDVRFPSLQLKNYGAAAFYFFNHGRYYQGAAYNYSKIQKRSQGSFILGLSVSHQDISFDLSTLPEEMVDYLPKGEPLNFNFVYNDYCIIAGYGYNWAFGSHWVLNFTGMPAFGLKHCSADNGDGRKNLPAVNLAARSGVAYNLQNFFVGVNGYITANWYINEKISFINAVGSFGVATGLRF